MSRADSLPATSYPLPATSEKPIVFGCYGALGRDPRPARPKKGESRPWGRSRTESLGGLKDEQPEVGPKGAASGAMQVKDCRKAAPKGELGWENQ